MIEPLFTYLFYSFIGLALIQLLFYWLIFGQLAFRKRKSCPNLEPVSVVICARNEYENLKENLPLFLAQDYPDYEIVVVNDASDDETYYFLKNLATQHKHLKVVNMGETPNFFKGKKFPLSIGIKSAKHDLLLLTDADCVPAEPTWIMNMASGYCKKVEVVLGYGGYEVKPGLLNKLIRFDTLHIAMQYLGLAIAGMPYMGVGRNLSYRKSLFYKNKGFISHYSIPSGDDDLFINQVSSRKNTAVVATLEGITLSEPKISFGEWFKQKRRHLTTGSLYKPQHKFILGTYSLSQLLYFVTGIILLSWLFQWEIVAAIMVFRLITQIIIVKKCMKRLGEKNLLLFSPVFEIIMMIINPMIALSNLIVKQKTWR